MVAHEWRGIDREVHDEDRPALERLDDVVLEELLDELAGDGGRLDRDPRLRAQAPKLRLARRRGYLSAERLGGRSVERDLGPDPGEVVDAAVSMHDLERAHRSQRSLLDELTRESRHVSVVGVGLVELEHRELRRVARVGALIAEVSVDLEDALDAADDRSLEE